MLKALMLRQTMMLDSDRVNFSATVKEWKTVNQDFKKHLGDAVTFVNGKSGELLRQYLTQ
jgi:hypothetical protein